MKGLKEIERLNRQRFEVKPRQAADRDGFEEFSRKLRDVVIHNLNLSPGEKRDAEKSWTFDIDHQRFWFEMTFALAVEMVGHYSVDAHKTKHTEVTTTFQFEYSATLPLEDLIAGLAEDIRRFKLGLAQARSLQLKHVLATEGVEAYEAAIDRGH